MVFCRDTLVSNANIESACRPICSEPLILDTPNIGHFSGKDTCFDYGVLILSCIHVHLCIKDNFHGPSMFFIQRLNCSYSIIIDVVNI